MKIHSIAHILINSVVIYLVHSTKYPYISECDYNNIDHYIGSNGLSFICTEQFRENKLFDTYEKHVCRNQHLCDDHCKDGFYDFKIGFMKFENCELSQLPKDLLQIYHEVHTLDMANLGVASLQPNNFDGAKRLTRLNASHNKIDIIPANLFNQSTRIVDLDLSFNNINHFDPDACSAQNQLKILNLSFNNISELTVNTFQKLIKLERLLLSNNQIMEIPSFLFHKTDKLIDVDLSFNKIHTLDDFAFSGDLSLNTLNLSHNKLQHLQRNILTHLANVTQLDVSWNQIAVLTPNMFGCLKKLINFDLSGNPIGAVSNETFVSLVKLKHLNLSRTSLLKLESGAFSMLEDLETLDLSNNQLKTMDANILSLQSNQLKWLSIANNQLQEFNGFTSERIPNVKIIGIDSNQFNCSYFNQLFQSITWKHLDSISHRINCSSAHEITESHGRNWTHATVDNTTELPTTKESLISSTEKIINQNDTLTPDESEKITTMERSTKLRSDNELVDLNLLTKYFFVLIGVMLSGFTVIIVVFSCLILRMGVVDRQTPQKELDIKNHADSSNIICNHIYDIIEMNTK